MNGSIRGRGAACLASLLAALSFTAAAQTPAARAPDAPAGVCAPARPHPAGLASFSVESGGLERRYFLYVPSGYDGASPRPLVLDFHGSGGARLASELACARPDRIAALGAVGGLRAPQGCGPVPVIAFHGTADRINPYAGGGPAYWGYGVEAAVAGWARANGCSAAPVDAAGGSAVTALRYAQCEGAAVAFYRVDGGGHTWPGSAFAFPPGRFGATTHEIDATTVMLEFFRAHGGRTRAAAAAGGG